MMIIIKMICYNNFSFLTVIVFFFLPHGPPPFNLLAGQISSFRQPWHLGVLGKHRC